jgi:hypothetical protein
MKRSGRNFGESVIVEECRVYLALHATTAAVAFNEALTRGDEPIPILKQVEIWIGRTRSAEFLLEHSVISVFIRIAARMCVSWAKKLKSPRSIREVLLGNASDAEIPHPFYLDGEMKEKVKKTLWKRHKIHGELCDVSVLLDEIGLERTKANISVIAEVLGHNFDVHCRYETLRDAKRVIKEDLGINVGTGHLEDLRKILSTSPIYGGYRCLVLYPHDLPLPVEAVKRFHNANVKLRSVGKPNEPILNENCIYAIRDIRRDVCLRGAILASCIDYNFDPDQGVIELPLCVNNQWTDDVLEQMEKDLEQNGIVFDSKRPRKRICTENAKSFIDMSVPIKTVRKRAMETQWIVIKVGSMSTGDQIGEEDIAAALEFGRWQLKKNGSADSVYIATQNVSNEGEWIAGAPGEVPHPFEWSSMNEDVLLTLFREEHRQRVKKTVEEYCRLTENGVVALVPFPSATLGHLEVHQKVVRSQASANRCRTIPWGKCRQITFGDYGLSNLGMTAFPQFKLDGIDDELLRTLSLERSAFEEARSEARKKAEFQSLFHTRKVLRENPTCARFVTVRDVLSTQIFRSSEHHEQVVLFSNGVGSSTMEFVDVMIDFARTRCEKAEHVLLIGVVSEAYGKRIVTSGAKKLYASHRDELMYFQKLLKPPKKQLDDNVSTEERDAEDPELGMSKELIHLVDKLIDDGSIENEQRERCLKALKRTEEGLASLCMRSTICGGCIRLSGDSEPEVPNLSSPAFRLGLVANYMVKWCVKSRGGGGVSFCNILYEKTDRCTSWHLRDLAHQRFSPVSRQMVSVRLQLSPEAVQDALEKTDEVLRDNLGEGVLKKLIELSKDPEFTGITFYETLLFFALWHWRPDSGSNSISVFSPFEKPKYTIHEFLELLKMRCICAVRVASILIKYCKGGNFVGTSPERAPGVMNTYIQKYERLFDLHCHNVDAHETVSRIIESTICSLDL